MSELTELLTHDPYVTDTNKVLATLPSPERIAWAASEFGQGLFALSSFGVDSAVQFKTMQLAGVSTPIVSIDTGFWFAKTHEFKARLVKDFGLDVYTFGPLKQDVAQITKYKLWQTDINAYHELTKHQPIRRAIDELGIVALLSGVRSDQTASRAMLKYVDTGNGGEYRVHPLLDWSQVTVEDFINEHELPRHPLHAQGYGSVGDYTTTAKGTSRLGRVGMGAHLECGLHVKAS